MVEEVLDQRYGLRMSFTSSRRLWYLYILRQQTSAPDKPWNLNYSGNYRKIADEKERSLRTGVSATLTNILEAGIRIITACPFSGWFSMLQAIYLVLQCRKETKDGYDKTDKRSAGRKGTN